MPERCLTSFGILAVVVVVLSMVESKAEVFGVVFAKFEWIAEIRGLGEKLQPQAPYSEAGSRDSARVTCSLKISHLHIILYARHKQSAFQATGTSV